MSLIGTVLSNVPLGVANILSYSMLVVVAIFLLSGTSLTYYYWRKVKKSKAASATGSV